MKYDSSNFEPHFCSLNLSDGFEYIVIHIVLIYVFLYLTAPTRL